MCLYAVHRREEDGSLLCSEGCRQLKSPGRGIDVRGRVCCCGVRRSCVLGGPVKPFGQDRRHLTGPWLSGALTELQCAGQKPPCRCGVCGALCCCLVHASIVAVLAIAKGSAAAVACTRQADAGAENALGWPFHPHTHWAITRNSIHIQKLWELGATQEDHPGPPETPSLLTHDVTCIMPDSDPERGPRGAAHDAFPFHDSKQRLYRGTRPDAAAVGVRSTRCVKSISTSRVTAARCVRQRRGVPCLSLSERGLSFDWGKASLLATTY